MVDLIAKVTLREQTISSLIVLILENKKWFVDNEFTVEKLRAYLWQSAPIKEYIRKMRLIMPPETHIIEIKYSALEIVNTCLFSKVDIESERIILDGADTSNYVLRILNIREYRDRATYWR